MLKELDKDIITRANAVIAQYIKLEVHPNGMFEHPCKNSLSLGGQFDCSWDWLMPVVERLQTELPIGYWIFQDRDSWGLRWNANAPGGHKAFYWADYKHLKEEINRQKKEAKKFGEKYEPEGIYIARGNIDAAFRAVFYVVREYMKSEYYSNLTA